MPTSLEVTYSKIRRDIGVLLGFDRTPGNWTAIQSDDVASCIDEGLNTFYLNAVDPRTNRIHQWSFLKPPATLTTNAPYTTGTVEIVAGVVTLTGGTFPSWAGTATLDVDGNQYEVDTRDGNTQITLVDTSVAVDSGTDYSLGRNIYDMPADYMGMDSDFTFASGEGGYYPAIKLVTGQEIRNARSHWNQSWPPIIGALLPKDTDNTASQTWRLHLFPTPDLSYVLHYTYRRVPPTLDTTYSYAWGGAPYSLAIKFACLAAAEVKLKDAMLNYSAKYQQALIAAIDNDRSLNAAQYLGTLQDPREPTDFPEARSIQPRTSDLTLMSGYAS